MEEVNVDKVYSLGVIDLIPGHDHLLAIDKLNVKGTTGGLLVVMIIVLVLFHHPTGDKAIDLVGNNVADIFFSRNICHMKSCMSRIEVLGIATVGRVTTFLGVSTLH